MANLNKQKAGYPEGNDRAVTRVRRMGLQHSVIIAGTSQPREVKMERIKFLPTRLYNNLLFKNKYVCPNCSDAWALSWSFSPGYCGRCGTKFVKQDNRFNLCPVCGAPKNGNYCQSCGYEFMRLPETQEDDRWKFANRFGHL